MPIAIARFRSIGIAFTIAFRSPVRTRRVITSALDDDHAHRLRVA